MQELAAWVLKTWLCSRSWSDLEDRFQHRFFLFTSVQVYHGRVLSPRYRSFSESFLLDTCVVSYILNKNVGIYDTPDIQTIPIVPST